jgi:hypothetical protein
MIETLPTEIHGAAVTAGPARSVVEAPILNVGRVDHGAHITSSRTQTACHIPGGGRFWVERGNRVVVEAGDDDRPVPWLHATVGAFVLAQQGRFALHANVVEVNGTVIAICGVRGAGKSTTSLALSQRGHRLITDDVATLDVDGPRVVHRSAGRPVTVHPATAERLGVSIEAGVPVVGNTGKLALANPAAAPVEVQAIVLLRAVAQHGAGVQLRQLSAVKGARVVHRHAYRRAYLDPVWSADMFEWAAAVAGRVPVWLLARAADGWTAEAVCATVEDLG